MTAVSLAQPHPVSKRLVFAICGLCIPVLAMELGCGSSGRPNTSDLAPVIADESGNQSVRVGASVTFYVVASGTAPLSYQWSKNKAAISGATSATYATPAAAPTDNGQSSAFR